MKKILSIVLLCMSAALAHAQEPSDALRYSFLTQGGTARNQAIGGAGASLGGEFSSLFINPAGLSFYKTNEFVLTPGYNFFSNKSLYANTNTFSKSNGFNLGASGFIISIPQQPGRAIKNYTVSLGINRMADFKNSISYGGTNNTSSFSEKYLDELQGNNVTDPNDAVSKFPFGSSLALNTYLIDTAQENGQFAGFKTLVPIGENIKQENSIATSGGVTDISLGGGVNVNDKFYAGATLSVPVVKYDRKISYKESDLSGNTDNDFNFFTAEETLTTKGFGVNGKFGIIYKPVEYVRLGFAVHTPVYYELTDNYTTTITTDVENYTTSGVLTQSSNDLTGDAPGEFKYTLVTPAKFIASASYVFREIEDVNKQKGFITADVEYIDYKSQKFNILKSDAQFDTYFNDVNVIIKDQYKGAFNVRVGGELKFNTIMFRLGGAYYSNPYKTDKANKIKLSGGLGYRNHGFFADLTYVYAMNKDVNYPYRLTQFQNTAANIKSNAGNVVATIGVKL
jgi:hypothetical protein